MSVLEQLRSDQEEIELLERAVVKALFLKAENPRNQVLADTMIKHFLAEITIRSKRALEAYQDSLGLKATWIDYLEGLRETEGTGDKAMDVWINFYEQIAYIKDYHTQFTPYGQPAAVQDEDWYFSHALDDRSIVPRFSGPEGYGRFVDLHECFLEFINLKKLGKLKPAAVMLDYVTYLKTFDQFFSYPRAAKDHQYEEYLDHLTTYLKDFFTRTQPLLNLTQMEQMHARDFSVRWGQRNVPGWTDIPKQHELSANPLYCLVCKKLFSNANIKDSHKSGRKHKKHLQDFAESLTQDASLEAGEVYERLAYKETLVMRYRENLTDTIEDTMNNIRKKQTRTAEELEAEMYLSEEDEPLVMPIEEIRRRSEKKQKAQTDSSDEEELAYNPRNLPIGFDGKPIPYWLYRLHGLNIEYKCEICGNYSYWGRRAFERHFQEWRHAYGMRCLRIPNTMHFKEITKIDEAIAMHKKLIEDHSSEKFRPEDEEELEDNEGNVLTRKTFEFLQRQGI
jgi:hypothetical protein